MVGIILVIALVGYVCLNLCCKPSNGNWARQFMTTISCVLSNWHGNATKIASRIAFGIGIKLPSEL
jgi:hypothetical protein